MSEPSGSRQPREGGASDDTMLHGLRSWFSKGLKRAKAGDSVRETLEGLIEDRKEG